MQCCEHLEIEGMTPLLHCGGAGKFKHVPKQHVGVGVGLVSETDSFGCITFGGQFMSHPSIGFLLFWLSFDDASERTLKSLMSKFSDLWLDANCYIT
ncbi:hypothetical protein H5410_034187 [Solanum commersonii]|uniref:Uncharacterized protein n=1 Tax=Solanum commersonii TaxID=4109 RepID=A0A9J5YQP8_SOLCO|nr:hypothetical protein H5410_034187 [Solanum commersonii]